MYVRSGVTIDPTDRHSGGARHLKEEKTIGNTAVCDCVFCLSSSFLLLPLDRKYKQGNCRKRARDTTISLGLSLTS